MKIEDRQILYDALMQGAPETPEAMIELAEVVTYDLDVLEPLIDKIIARAQNAPLDLTQCELGVDVIPDGASCYVDLTLIQKHGARKIRINVDRSRLRTLCAFLIQQSGA